MVDIHTHILPNVDDGSKDFIVSVDMLREEVNSGVDNIVFTPHYEEQEFNNDNKKLLSAFESFKSKVEKEFSGLKLSLGEEIFVNDDIYEKLKKKELLTINGTNALLLEFPYHLQTDIQDYVYNLKTMGYLPIIAHVERYVYAKTVEDVRAFKESGALIQVNAEAVMGRAGNDTKKFVLKLIKYGLVDFIASDYHANRHFRLLEAYNFIRKKFGNVVANELFDLNARKYLNV